MPPPGDRMLGGGPGDGGALTLMASTLAESWLCNAWWLSIPGVLASFTLESSAAEVIIPKPGQYISVLWSATPALPAAKPLLGGAA